MNLIRGLLFDNLGLKLVALLLALLVYLNVYTDRPATMVVSFPLQITDLPDSMTLVGPAPSAVQAELRGSGKQLIRLRLAEPVLRISLANARPGRYERALGAGDLPLPPESGPQVERLIGPLMIELQIDRKETRRIPVAPRGEVEPGAGREWSGRVQVEPARVVVTGPASVLARLDSIRLEPVRIEGRRDTMRVEVSPAALPEWTLVEPPTVMVIVPLRRTRP